jgi:uncharacterized lipoprotein YmbA
MDNKIVIVPLNLFSLNQTIFIVDKEKEKTQIFTTVEVSTLPEAMVEACVVYSTSEIKIIGNTNYAQALANEIKEYSTKYYSNKELNITITEE